MTMPSITPVMGADSPGCKLHIMGRMEYAENLDANRTGISSLGYLRDY